MNSWGMLGVIVAIAIFLASIFYGALSSVDKKIDAKLQEPLFLKKLASQIRLPFLIFDEEKRYLADDGALDIIKNIEIIRDGRDIKQIIITPKRFLAVAPILESLDPDVQFEDAERGKELDWVYKTNLPETTWGRTKAPKKRFKLQIIELRQ
jgi:hypothetical protein